MKTWSAFLDACPICRGLHGETVPVGESYRSGFEPGLVHPSCRCLDIISAVSVP